MLGRTPHVSEHENSLATYTAGENSEDRQWNGTIGIEIDLRLDDSGPGISQTLHL